MHRMKYIIRGMLLLVIAGLLISLYHATENNITQIAKFKLDTFNKVNADSLDAKHKLDVLVNETKKFNEQFVQDSPHVKNNLLLVIGAVGLLIMVELAFFITERRKRTGD